MPEVISCELCGVACPTHASYVVRIDVFADPSLPDMSDEALAALDMDQALSEVIEASKGMTAEDLQDGVHRRFEYRLCPRCQKSFLTNPLGTPRAARIHVN